MNHIKKYGIAALVGLVFPFVSMASTILPSDPAYDVLSPSPSPSPSFDATGAFNMTAQPAPQGGGSSPSVPTQGGGAATNVSGASQIINFPNPTPYDTVMGLLESILKALVSILIPVITVMFVYSGFLFVTAGGNEKKLEDAKKTLLGVVIGAALVLGAWVLAQAIANTISGLG